MKRGFLLGASLAGALAVTLGAPGCSKKSNPTMPAPPTNSFDSGTLTAPTSFDHVFNVAGSVPYHCNFHQALGMIGTVIVAAGGDSVVTDTASNMMFRPATVTVRPGGMVHWVILDGTHTVTSNAPASSGGGGGGGGGGGYGY